MMNLFDFDLWQILLSQILGVIALVIYFITNQHKSKKRYLLLMALGGVFNILMLVTLQMWLLSLFGIISLVRNISFYFKESYKDRIPPIVNILILLIFFSAAVITTIFTVEIWFEWVAMSFFLIHIFGLWYKGVHLAKLSDMVYCICLAVLNILILNVMGIVIAANTIISIVIFYMILLVKKQNPETDEAI